MGSHHDSSGSLNENSDGTGGKKLVTYLRGGFWSMIGGFWLHADFSRLVPLVSSLYCSRL